MAVRMRLAAALLAGSAGSGALAQNAAGPAITVSIERSIRNQPVYLRIAEHGVQPSCQPVARLGPLRWGGDGTTCHNWWWDSSNAGFNWYFMSGSGVANPVPGAGPDTLVARDKAAGSQTLLTILIIPYVNNSLAWNCSFPVSVYGARQPTNPYVHPNGSSSSASGAQRTDTHVLSNNVVNTTAFQVNWVRHLVGKWGRASAGDVQLCQLDNEPLGWSNTHRDVEPNGASCNTIVTLG